jgi:hypothetical protein
MSYRVNATELNRLRIELRSTARVLDLVRRQVSALGERAKGHKLEASLRFLELGSGLI